MKKEFVRKVSNLSGVPAISIPSEMQGSFNIGEQYKITIERGSIKL